MTRCLYAREAVSKAVATVTGNLGRTDVGGVVRGAEDELRGAIVAGANVADVRLSCDEDLGRAKVAKLEDPGGGVEKEVLGLDVAVTDADGVDVHEGAEELVHIQLDLEHGHGLLELDIVAAGAVDGLWDVFEHKVEVHFIFLWVRGLGSVAAWEMLCVWAGAEGGKGAHLVSIRVEKGFKVDDVGM